MKAVLTPEQKEQLFDRGQFRAELTLSSSALPAYKKYLKHADRRMNQWFDKNLPIQTLVYGRAWLIDQILVTAWEYLIGPDHDDICLLAVGGYGRGELHPHSDIDLLILLRSEDPGHHEQNIGKFLTLLWDIDLEVGSSVRSVAECGRQAEQDLTIITNLIESRVLSGPKVLHKQMQKTIDCNQMWPSQEYLKAKFEEQRQRHKKFNDTEYNLEPNIKSSPGGLRDLHMIGWVARRHYGTDRLEKLTDIGFLTEHESNMLVRARDFLWQVRWGLHRLSNRPEDRLLFDHQRTLASQFGYEDKDGSLALEQFMQKYFRAMMTLGELNDLLLQHFDDEILNVGGPQNIITLNDRFRIRKNYLEITDDRVFEQHPPAILEMFVLLTQHPTILGARASTIRQLRDSRHLIDDTFRSNQDVINLFLELMKAPYALTATLRRMIRYGILGRYLPEFGRIIGQMQHDLFHIYSVDAHTLLLIKFLRTFNYHSSRELFPVACSAKQRLPKPHLLYIAGLFHDIAKGRGGNHSKLGAVDALAFCQRHQLSKPDAALVAWLVEHHLTMSVTAQRKDLSDLDTIHEFAQLVGDQRHLDYLYCLTVADINATNPKLWNGWRASLLRQLYRETKRALLRGLGNPIDKQDRIHDSQVRARSLLQGNGVDDSAIDSLWSQLGDEYFLRHTADEIAWHSAGILEHNQSDESSKPLIMIRETTQRSNEGGTIVFVYTHDTINLFAAITTALDQVSLTIHDARIITSANRYSLDSFVVQEAATGRPIGDNPQRVETLRKQLQTILQEPDTFTEIIRRRTSRQLKHFAKTPEITINTDTVNDRTVVEVMATDRPGLLAMMGRTFMELNLLVQNAKIATLGEKVEDVFFITESNGHAISDSGRTETLHQTLMERVQAYAAEDALSLTSSQEKSE